MVEFRNKILFVGYGSVAQCTLPMLEKLINVPLQNVTVMDFEDQSGLLKPWTEKGLRFVRDKITEKNMGSLLPKYLKAGDLLIDLAWNIDACELLQWCHDNGVLYINTSVELWDPYSNSDKKHPVERTLYWRHMKLREMTAGWKEKGVTAVIEHGANPGLISHWTKKGLIDIAEKMLDDKKASGADADEIKQYIKDRSFNRLAMKTGVKVIHCSERDTQVTDKPKMPDEFVNTWSIEGLREEGVATSELGWGTHEKELPPFAYQHQEGPQNQICLAAMGINTLVRSWVPDYCINGMVIRHGEAFTISDKLTVWENGKAVYRPTMHYAYCLCDSAIASLNEFKGYNYELQPKLRIMNDEITTGADILGALLMGHPYNSWWTGSRLTIEESRRLVPHQNATTMQVAISVLAASMWMIKNPAMGVCIPDDLPHDEILAVANPYLGDSLSVASDWTPLKYRKELFADFKQQNIDTQDPWQFKNFMVSVV
ncbi:MAG: homospermidine synthase [Lentisphaerae bacterium GWF2_44_16]|nr:MAG: homospermidine synthase [Lentisphaerae bacterium GWF2_44_16]